MKKKQWIKTFFGVGLCVGFALIMIGFVAWLFGELYRIAIFAGTMLFATGVGYANCIEEDSKK